MAVHRGGDALRDALAQVEDLRRQVMELRRQLAAARQQQALAESERRQWRGQARFALTMDDPEYIRDALEKLA